MNFFAKALTFWSFIPEFYKEVKAKGWPIFIALIILFSFVRILLVAIPASYSFAKDVGPEWQKVKGQLSEMIKKERFTYFAIENDRLVTDLRPMPFTITETSSSGANFVFVIDTTGRVDDSILADKGPGRANRVMGIALLRNKFVTKNSNGRLQSFLYSDMFEGEDVRITKKEMLDFLSSNFERELINRLAGEPGVMVLFAFIVVFLITFFAIIVQFQHVIWAAIMAIFAALLMPAGEKDRYIKGLKMATVGFVGSWYFAEIIKLLLQRQSYNGQALIENILIPVLFIVIFYQATKHEKQAQQHQTAPAAK